MDKEVIVVVDVNLENKSDFKPSKNLEKALKEVENISKGKVVSKGYHNVHEMFEDILNEN